MIFLRKRSILFKVVFIFLLGFLLYFFIFHHNQRNTKPELLSEFSDTYQLLILIISRGKNVENRDAIRNTWLTWTTYNNETKYLFVIGGKNIDYDAKELDMELNKHKDILLLHNVSDSYDGLTYKLLHSFTWLKENMRMNFKFLLKVDDDTFVRTYAIAKELKLLYNTTNNLYWGFFTGTAKVKRSGKWSENNWILCDRYIPYAIGGGYVISVSLVRYVANNHNLLSIHRSEDVTMGVWLAALNLTRIHDPRFDTEYLSRGCSNSYLVTHKKTPSDMYFLFDTLRKTGSLCMEEYKFRLSYEYNWTVPPSKCCLRTNATIP